MRKTVLCIIWMLMGIVLNAQPEGYQHVEGTNIFLSPPDGFTISENFKGFANPEDPYSMIMVVEMPGPFSKVSAGFDQEKLAAAGMKLRVKEEQEIAGKKGIYIELDQNASGFEFTKALLIFGDEQKTSIVNGTCLLENKELYENLKQSIANIYVDEALNVDPRLALDFTVDETIANLKFISVVGNGMLFNRDGKIPTESPDELNILMDKSYAEVAIDDLEAFSRQRLAQLPGNYEIADTALFEVVEYDGLTGVHILASNNVGEQMMQVILPLSEGGYYIFIASAKGMNESIKSEIKDFLFTFEQKINE